MNVYELLLEKAAAQLDQLTSAVDKDAWFESLVERLKKELDDSGLDGGARSATDDALQIVIDNKHLIIGLGAHAFTLLMYQLSLGKTAAATETYIRSLTTADDLIALMNATSDGVYRAKLELDKKQEEAKQLILNILSAGARHLLPFLLSLI